MFLSSQSSQDIPGGSSCVLCPVKSSSDGGGAEGATGQEGGTSIGHPMFSSLQSSQDFPGGSSRVLCLVKSSSDGGRAGG